jgi:serine/threonine protein kinase
LSNDKLLIFSPPTSINQFNKNIPHSKNSEPKNTVIYSNNSNKAGFTYFSKVEYLGSGGFSKVYKYRGDLENKAVKKIMADPKYYSKVLTAEDSIKREVYGMTKVDCNHSLKVYGVYQNTNKDIFYILMEQCDGNIEKYMNDRGYPLNINEIIIL